MIVAGGLAGCAYKLSDITTGQVAPESPEEETSESSAKDGQSEIKTADTPPENKDKPARKPRPQTAKAPKKPAAPARAETELKFRSGGALVHQAPKRQKKDSRISLDDC